MEQWIADHVEVSLDGQRAKCLLGECEPQWDAKRPRWLHVESCQLVAVEQLLRKRVDPYDSPLYRRAIGKE